MILHNGVFNTTWLCLQNFSLTLARKKVMHPEASAMSNSKAVNLTGTVGNLVQKIYEVLLNQGQ